MNAFTQYWTSYKLRAKDPSIRKCTIEGLGMLGEKAVKSQRRLRHPFDVYYPVIETLRQALKTDSEPTVRRAAAEALMNLRPSFAYGDLENALLDVDETVRRKAAAALRKCESYQETEWCSSIGKRNYTATASRSVWRLQDQDIIAGIAQFNSDAILRLAAVRALENQDILATVAQSDVCPKIRHQAVLMIRDQTALANVAEGDVHVEVACAAIERLSDKEALARIIYRHPLSETRRRAVLRIDNQDVLSESAIHDVDRGIREAALDRVEDVILLVKVAVETSDDKICKAAAQRFRFGKRGFSGIERDKKRQIFDALVSLLKKKDDGNRDDGYRIYAPVCNALEDLLYGNEAWPKTLTRHDLIDGIALAKSKYNKALGGGDDDGGSIGDSYNSERRLMGEESSGPSSYSSGSDWM